MKEEYLGRSRLYRRLRGVPHGQLVERYAARLIEERLVRHGAWRCLNAIGALLSWIAGRRYELVDLDQQLIERYSEVEAGGSLSNPVTVPRSSDGSRYGAWKARSRRWCCRLSPRTDGSSRSAMPTCEQSAGPSPEVHRPPSPGHPQAPARGVRRWRRRFVQDQPRRRDPTLTAAPRIGARDQEKRCTGRCAPFSVTSTIGG